MLDQAGTLKKQVLVSLEAAMNSAVWHCIVCMVQVCTLHSVQAYTDKLINQLFLICYTLYFINYALSNMPFMPYPLCL